MSRHYPWNLLGIDPTTDTRAVRIAYSARLKAIDVDADPQAFIALRDAFERARDEAQWRANGDWFDGDEAPEPVETEAKAVATQPSAPTDAERVPAFEAEAFGEDELAGDEYDEEPPPYRYTPPPYPQVQTAEPEEHAEVNAHARALVSLLYEIDGAGRAPSDEECARMLAHFDAILADPRMLQVAFFADAEAWLGDLIAHTSPASDPLLARAVAHFGWSRTHGTITQSHAANFAVRRLRALAFVNDVSARSHPLHAAWHQLSSPEGSEYSWRGQVKAKKVHELLATIRRDFPDLENSLNSYRVARWDVPVDQPKKRSAMGFVWIGAVILLALIRVFGSGLDFGTKSNLPPPVVTMFEPVKSEAADIGFALKLVGDGELDWATVQRRNPKMAMVLKSNWQIARENGENRVDFGERMRKLMDERFRNGIATADYQLIAAFRQLRRDQAAALRERDPALCDGFFRGTAETRMQFVPEINKRERALVSRVLLETDGDPPAKPRSPTFRLPASAAEDAIRRAGIGAKRFEAAALGKGTPADRCTARIALIDAALAMPRGPGLKLLREM